MVVVAVFRGDDDQRMALLVAVEHHCTCSDPEIARGSCPAHRALLDQRLLDGILFARFLTRRLLAEEFD